MARVLVVEDNLMNLELLVQLLADEHEVLTSRDGRQGVDTALEELPDVVIMDLSLPVMDGWQATELLKGDPATRAIPVIALTAHAMPGDAEKARAAGCDEVLTKPLDEDLLFATLRRCLRAGSE